MQTTIINHKSPNVDNFLKIRILIHQHKLTIITNTGLA